MFNSLPVKKLAILLLLVVIPMSCKKDRYVFPYVHVDIYALLTTLDQIGYGESKFMYDDAGLNGLVIYRDPFNGSYSVFDRTCTYEPDFSCKVDTSSFTSFLKCPCCGSIYALDEGGNYVAQGPARYPLKQYNAIVEGGFLHIFN